MKWNDLSMQEKSDLMAIAVKNGIYSLEEIKNTYNKYDEGGSIDIGENQRQRYAVGLPAVSTEENPIIYNDYEENILPKIIKSRALVKEIRDKQIRFKNERLDTNKRGIIPYIPEKRTTLTNAGKDTGVSLSTNMLDSIAKHANVAGLPIRDALGLAGQESTFGKGYWKEAEDIEPVYLVSDWNYDGLRRSVSENPYDALFDLSAKKVKGNIGYYDENKNMLYNEEYIKALEEGLQYANKMRDKLRTDIPVLEHAFRKFKAGKYNPNDPNHTRMVKERGEDLIKSPQIIEWARKNNIKL